MTDKPLAWGAAMLLACMTPAIAGADGLLSGGKILLNLRYRLEHVEQDGFAKDANASTIRVRAGYKTPAWQDFAGLFEIEATGHFSEDFNDTINGRAEYPVVADPENLEVNRAQIAYSGIPDTGLTVGRQRINLDDKRFIGAVGFRQNEQTFDAVRVDNSSIERVTLTYFFANRVNRVFGERSPMGHFDGAVQAFNVSYAEKSLGKLTGYLYLLDLDQAPLLSTATFGLRFSGNRPLGDGLSLAYAAAYARQEEYADNPLSFGLDYWLGEVELGYDAWSLKAGVESLGSNGIAGFSTPLATLHKFQGYADVFTSTPARGVRDTYAAASFGTDFTPFDAKWEASFTAWYHDFRGIEPGGSLGEEIDLEASVKTGWGVTLSLTYAAYGGDGGFASRDKIWLAIDYAL
ncbi:MAG: hypothetical protein ACT4OG_09950 [Alphaproteobacteria bacterium]